MSVVRRKATNCNVDETLFGNPKKNRAKSAPSSRPLLPAVTVISQSELSRIKNEAWIKTAEEIEAEREKALEAKKIREKISRDRMMKMRALEKKAESMRRKSDMEIADEARAETIRLMAEDKLDQNNDMVKLLNSLASRAEAFTIRDAQLKEKEHREAVEREYNRRMDMEMEIDRLRELQRRETEERERVIKRRDDRKVINEQMEYRQRQKLLMLEAKEQENMAMRAITAKYAEEDREKKRKQQLEIERSRLEVIKANEDAIRRKGEARELEKKEVQDILIYQQLKDAEMLKREQEELALEQAKKERQAKLLAQQEKAQSNLGKLDEVRARRAQEEHERRARKKERDEAMKRKADLEVLSKARVQQAAERKQRLELEKRLREEEYRDGLMYAKSMAEREEKERTEHQRKIEQHRANLHKQMEERELMRMRNRSDNTDIGLDYKQGLIKEEAKLEVMRTKMIADMESKGVNPKYLGEMRNVDIRKLLVR